MAEDSFGFSVPEVDAGKCIGCGKCLRVCPFKNRPVAERLDSPVAFAALHRDAKVRKASTSGGVFHALAKAVLLRNGVVFGAAMDGNFRVAHVGIERVEEIPRLQKSKYVQSAMENNYALAARFLKEGRKVLFSGTPCQVAGLLGYLGDVPRDNLIAVEVICHGVPNQRLFDEYRIHLESRIGKISWYKFRFKSKADFGLKWFVACGTRNRTRVRNWPEDSYAYFYMKGLTYRDSCYRCPFAKPERIADVTLCDYWHWEGRHARQFQPGATVSGVLANTPKGLALLETIRDEVTLVPSDFAWLSANNSCLLRPIGTDSALRRKVLATWKEKGYACLDSQFRKRHRRDIARFWIMRHVPDWILRFARKVKHEH